nr:AAA family ATPase [Brevibacillus laterosporus]
MKLYSFKIEGFRKHTCTTIFFSDATFLLGENNIGKSSILKALEYYFKGTKRIPVEEFSRMYDKDSETEKIITEKIVLTAEFRNVPIEANEWHGFKGRLLPYEIQSDTKETGLRIVYKKTYEIDKDFEGEMKEYKKVLKDTYNECKTVQDFIDKGVSEEVFKKIFGEIKLTKKINDKDFEKLREEYLELFYDETTEEEVWAKNPGGISANILSKLPKFVFIPAQDKVDELSSQKGALMETLNELFNDVREASDHFGKAQYYLNLLAEELDPEDEESELSQLLTGLNKVISDVFPDITIMAKANLSDPRQVLNPKFDISMGSNVNTRVEQQGTGVIRSAVFAMLRYRNMRISQHAQKDNIIRPIFIAFEEPEIYLHPKAVYQMRDTIYELACEPLNQIVCTTHSPFMIDLSRNSSQTLNHIRMEPSISNNDERITSNPFNVTKAFKDLQGSDKTYVKMLMKIDDSMAKVFFARNVLIIEGDTEDIVFRETISRMSPIQRKEVRANWEIVKARGKATIISLIKYLKIMGINPYVIHDKDENTPNAKKYNEPIKQALQDESRRIMLENCIEDILGYPAPSNNKPSTAYSHIDMTWGNNWESINSNWREIVESIFFSENKKQDAVENTTETLEQINVGRAD